VCDMGIAVGPGTRLLAWLR